MRAGAVVGWIGILLLAGSCGPDDGIETIQVVLRNRASESLFTLSVAIQPPKEFPSDASQAEGDKVADVVREPTTIEIFKDERADRGDLIKAAKTFKIIRGSKLTFNLRAITFGDTSRFEPFEFAIDKSTFTVGVAYDFDFTTARFTMEVGRGEPATF